jgi:hypothetical protein
MIYAMFIFYLAQRVAAVPPQEDANHFFFVCTKYSEIRNDVSQQKRFVAIDHYSHQEVKP